MLPLSEMEEGFFNSPLILWESEILKLGLFI
jgi:hypothetical protein